MEGVVFAGAGVVSAACSGAVLAGLAYAWSAKAWSSAKSQDAGVYASGASWRDNAEKMVRYLMRNGLPLFGFAARMVRRSRKASRYLEGAVRLLIRKGYAANAQSICELMCALAVFGFALGLAVSGSLVAALCLSGGCVFAVVAAGSHAADEEQNRLRELVPDALRCMESCFQAGLSLPQTFAETARETEPPLSQTFAQVSHDIELGHSVDEALDRFRLGSGLPELAFVAVALDVQYVSGGDATSVLRIAQDSVDHALELRRTLRVQTAQAKLSAQIVSAMPLVLVGVLSLVSPHFFNPFFETGTGLALLAMAASMLAGGILIVRRMLAVDLG